MDEVEAGGVVEVVSSARTEVPPIKRHALSSNTDVKSLIFIQVIKLAGLAKVAGKFCQSHSLSSCLIFRLARDSSFEPS